MSKHILNAIGKMLKEKGMCPYDSSCPFGLGNLCTAREDELVRRLQKIEEAIQDSSGSIALHNTTDPSPWPCENIWAVKFIDPD